MFLGKSANHSLVTRDPELWSHSWEDFFQNYQETYWIVLNYLKWCYWSLDVLSQFSILPFLTKTSRWLPDGIWSRENSPAVIRWIPGQFVGKSSSNMAITPEKHVRFFSANNEDQDRRMRVSCFIKKNGCETNIELKFEILIHLLGSFNPSEKHESNFWIFPR